MLKFMLIMLAVRLVKFEPKFLLIFFYFYFIFDLFSILEFRIRVRVMSQLYCYTIVTSNDIVTVMVT